jgi:thiol-disulfide isomerase/thioredoxin
VTVGRWQGRRVRRATRGDVAALGAIVLFAALAIVSGRRALLALEPRSAVENARALDDLEEPTRLPNAALTDRSGQSVPLLDRITSRVAAVAFYAPWCGPCQRELPSLVREVGPHAQILVVVSKDEDLDQTRHALANLGVTEFFVDATGQLQREARVTALPTTFLATRHGAVLARVRGYSEMGMYNLKAKAKLLEERAP